MGQAKRLRTEQLKRDILNFCIKEAVVNNIEDYCFKKLIRNGVIRKDNGQRNIVV